MDPDQTLRDLLTALDQQDWDRTLELAEGLQQWIERDGFPPQTLGPKSLGKAWHAGIARFVAEAAMRRVRSVRPHKSAERGA